MLMKVLLLCLLSIGILLRTQAQAPGGVSTGLQVWYKADAGTSSTVDAAFLDTWNDSSPNGKNATQTVVASRPQYYSNIINGNPAVRTSGTRFMNADFSGINDQNYTIFTVSLRQAGGSFNYIVGMQHTGTYAGLSLGYSGSGLIRQIHYGNWVNLACGGYSAANELPSILSCQFNQSAGKGVWRINDGVQNTSNNSNTSHYVQSGAGRIGRGNDSYGFNGFISEVIIYNRVLTAAEKRQVHTYLSVKYGLSIPVSEHLFYNEASYSSDIFGIGRDVSAQGLNQQVSNSVGKDDILEVRNPSSLDDGDYMVFGNNNGATTFGSYPGTDCSITSIMGRRWKMRKQNDPGNVTLRFDLTSISGFTPDDLVLLVDDEGNGFDDETPLTGTYSAPYFTIDNVNLADQSIVTIGTAAANWYAVSSGNASGAVWARTISGTPQVIASICRGSNLIVNTGVTINNDWTSLECKNFEVMLGAIWNAGTATVNINGNVTISGTYNAQSGSMNLIGSAAQTIGGNGICNAYNLTVNNTAGVTISASGGGVSARNLVTITSGTLYTNGKLTLTSDASSTGMIAALISGSISGNVISRRYHNASAQGWVNLSSPIQGKTLQDWNDDLVTTGFLGADYPPPYTFNNVQYYEESLPGGINVGYSGASNIINPITNGRGYFVFMNAGVMNLDVDGQINSGNITLPVTFTNTGNPSGDGWNLVGNPYPCTIDWNSPSWTKTNINNAVYVWNAALGQYASYVAGVGANGGSRYIPSSQSFFVVANGIGASLMLTENCKSSNQGNFKSNEIQNGVFTLKIDNGTYSDETTFTRNESGTLMFESEIDAFKLRSPMSEVPYIASISEDGYDVSINAFAGVTEETVIPLRMEVGTSGTYELSHRGLNDFANGACIVLEDLLTGSLYPLNESNKISLTLEAGNTNLRYQLRIGASSLNNITTAGCPGLENGTASVYIDDQYPADITWLNSSGDILAKSLQVTGIDEIMNLSSGDYEVMIESNAACAATSAEFTITEDQQILHNAVISPASCQQETDGAIVLNIMGGTAPYEVIWSNGLTSPVIENIEDGDYTAFVTDAKGCSQSFTLTVPALSSVSSGFETLNVKYEMMNGAVLVDFYNISNNATEYRWTFGDATQISLEENPSHLFNKKGVYEVTLTSSDGNCEAFAKRTIAVTNPEAEGSQFGSEMIGTLTDQGVQIMFFFDQARRIQINAYNVLGQQLIEPITGEYERQTITFSDRRYAANALIEVIDLNTGERALMRMGI